VTKLLDVLNRLAKTLNDAMLMRSRAPLSALLEHDNRGGPTP
jgi:hypothetical protein